ncbi:NADP-dependent isocitrate dehydrogenase [Tautonia plasticadhaerens]|uniref:Isocitrate dehydrogenase [NADP] n=1 Tax=Tautonia plasticadhaerens TaxID=2527974 RepID=A0A518HBF5_9BACT|nr:NADP-dependent isocitrate dehydrogenase [Tautonia plasticadhaerens]QDV38157.1 Isocitrate dehydrogenase [NADP] [Tautonia plasticadhaerens]
MATTGAGATPITVAHGDGIGPEIMEATLAILQEAGARLEIETIQIGEAVYKSGHTSGITPDAWDSLRRTKVFLKAPITTPQGGGFKSLNVTVRKTLGLYANIRPCVAYAPYVRTKHPGMDVVIVRENEEDLYAGIEHRQTDQVMQCLKLISRPGCEKIVRYAFDYAVKNNRKKVTCFTKDNIMKLTDGLFHKVFDEIAAEYPSIENEHWIIDIGAAKMADTPGAFDVIVMPNLYGDVLSDVAAQIAGSVGLAGSANIGDHCAMFEAIHGSAPRRAGQNLANPSGLFLGSVLMLVHIGEVEAAERAHNAWLKTLEDGIHTYDIFDEKVSKQKVGTREFAQAVIARLGQKPEQLKAVSYSGDVPEAGRATAKGAGAATAARKSKKELVGVDVFFDWSSGSPDDLGSALAPLAGPDLTLKMISNRGLKVWPDGLPETFCSDHWRCRFQDAEGGAPITHRQVVDLLGRIEAAGLDFIKTEHLCNFDGEPGFSLDQGQ